MIPQPAMSVLSATIVPFVAMCPDPTLGLVASGDGCYNRGNIQQVVQ